MNTASLDSSPACVGLVASGGRQQLRADEEQDLIATLQSSAGVPQKCAACQKLRIIGTARVVPALAALLGEERTSHAARYALEAMPCPEAGAALARGRGQDLRPDQGRPDRLARLAPRSAGGAAAGAAAGRCGRDDRRRRGIRPGPNRRPGRHRRAVRRAGQGAARRAAAWCSKACCNAPSDCWPDKDAAGAAALYRSLLGDATSAARSAPRRGGAWCWPTRASAST